MNFHSKEALLFLVQVDHLSGEILGDVVDSFYTAGAKNVQIISSVTKKNRPSCVILIDGSAQSREQIETAIIRELGSSGWHCIDTCHRYTDVSVVTKRITVQTEKMVFTFTARGKMIADDVRHIRPEYDSCVELKTLLMQKSDLYVPVKELHTALSNVFYNENICELVL